MRILFLTHYFPPEVNAPASRTHENAKRWVRLGHEVTVITCFPNCPRGEVFDGYRNDIRKIEYIDGIRVVRIWTFIAPNKGSVRRILNYLSYMVSATWWSLFEGRPDVLIATSPQFFCGWAGVLVARIRRISFILEIRDIWPESITTVGAMKKGAAIRFLETMEKAMYRAADHIVAVGKGYREQLFRRGVPGGKISVIYNGVDLERFSVMPKNSSFLSRYGLEGSRVLGYIGTVGMAHGLEVMLKAAEACREKPWKLLIVGDGARLDELKSEAQSRGLSNLVFTGRLSKEEMPAAWSVLDACLIHLKKSDLFATVIPSKMFEAMGMGIPILMAVKGEAQEIVLEAGAGIAVEPEDAEGVIKAFETIVRSDADLYGKSGARFVAERFNRDTLAVEYLNVLKPLLPMRN